MKQKIKHLLVFAMVVILFTACEKEDNLRPNTETTVETTNLKSRGSSMRSRLVHGAVVMIDGEAYYFAGPTDGKNGANDVPGHFWAQTGPNRVIGKHYNTGPWGMPKWWSSDAEDGALLYIVDGIIDTWSVKKAAYYKRRGFVHRHEFVSVADGSFHPSKVVWLKHTAVTSFTLDGGPGAPNPPYEHFVTPGLDIHFPNNGFKPYPEN